jgi:hypothetical protein
MKQQLLIIHRSRRRAPNLSVLDRFLFGFWSLFLDPRRIQRAAVIIRPSTLLKFHHLLKKRKYRLLYSSGRKGTPGPKGPSAELIQAIVELKQRNPRFGCLRIAQQINKAFGMDIDKDLVRRVLTKHPMPDDGGNLTVRLRHVSRRKLLLAGKRPGLALSALWYLGKNNVNASVISAIRAGLTAEEFKTLKNTDLPAWMAAALEKYGKAAIHA